MTFRDDGIQWTQIFRKANTLPNNTTHIQPHVKTTNQKNGKQIDPKSAHNSVPYKPNCFSLSEKDLWIQFLLQLPRGQSVVLAHCMQMPFAANYNGEAAAAATDVDSFNRTLFVSLSVRRSFPLAAVPLLHSLVFYFV